MQHQMMIDAAETIKPERGQDVSVGGSGERLHFK